MPKSKTNSSKQPVKSTAAKAAKPTSKSGITDWRDATLSRMRALILTADPKIIEEQKWRKPSNPAGVPVWSHGGIICTGETYKDKVKLTFPKGSSIADPAGLFNAGLEGTRRAIDIREGETVDAGNFKALIKSAVKLNGGSAKPSSSVSGKAKSTAKVKPVKLLSGGNPQIAKSDGNEPVRIYIAAMPGWKREIGEWLDAVITRAAPNVRKAVKWNSPFYGIEGQGWFLSFHVFAKYVKVAFFKGASLKPLPPGISKQKDVRYLDIREGDPLDEAQFAKWVKQAAKLAGWSGH